VLEEYRKHVAERAAEGIAPKPLDANQMAALVELLKNPPAGEEEFLLDLLTNRVPPGVDEAAYVKAGFLAAVAKGEAKSPLLTPEKAIELLGTMQGGYNIHPLIDALDDAKLAPIAAKALSHTLLMFDNFYDVEEKAKAGRKLLSDIEKKDIRIRPKCEEAFVMRGSYHMLANKLKVGWHVDFFERLKGLLCT